MEELLTHAEMAMFGLPLLRFFQPELLQGLIPFPRCFINKQKCVSVSADCLHTGLPLSQTKRFISDTDLYIVPPHKAVLEDFWVKSKGFTWNISVHDFFKRKH